MFKDETSTGYYFRFHFVPRSEHVSVTKIINLIFSGKITAVCSEIHTKHINTVCGQNVELLNVKLAVHIVTTVRYI
jgi:hypothetical protein